MALKNALILNYHLIEGKAYLMMLLKGFMLSPGITLIIKNGNYEIIN